MRCGGHPATRRQTNGTRVWNIRIADWNYAEDLLDNAVTFENALGAHGLSQAITNKSATAARKARWLPTLRIEYIPRLTITIETNELITVSWPGPADGWLLERTNVLSGASAPWPVVPPPYETNGGTISMTFTNTPAVGNQFFRLHKP